MLVFDSFTTVERVPAPTDFLRPRRPPRLRPAPRHGVAPQERVHKASLWEPGEKIAIKVSTRKLTLVKPFAELIADLRGTGLIFFVPIADAHLAAVAALPFHHLDPFDRLLVAQALAEGLTVVGNDAAFDAYGVARIW